MNSKLGRQHTKTPLAAALSPFVSLLYPPKSDVNDVMGEGWPQRRGLRPLLFSGVGFFTSHKNQISVSAVRRDVRFFILIRED